MAASEARAKRGRGESKKDERPADLHFVPRHTTPRPLPNVPGLSELSSSAAASMAQNGHYEKKRREKRDKQGRPRPSRAGCRPAETSNVSNCSGHQMPSLSTVAAVWLPPVQYTPPTSDVATHLVVHVRTDWRCALRCMVLLRAGALPSGWLAACLPACPTSVRCCRRWCWCRALALTLALALPARECERSAANGVLAAVG